MTEDKLRLQRVFKNVYDIVKANTPRSSSKEKRATEIEATGRIVAALIMVDKTIYFDII